MNRGQVIPKYHEFYIPVLACLKEKGPLSSTAIRTNAVEGFNLSQKDIAFTNDKGTNILISRVGWAIQYLFQSGALTRPQRNIYQITSLGESLLEENPKGFSDNELKNTEGFKKWEERMALSVANKVNSEDAGKAPQESIEQSLGEIEGNLASELVSRIQSMSPEFLEKTVLKLLGGMGYGSEGASLVHTGKSGDEGIDGVINQDTLGIQQIYIQAKRYQDGNNVGREAIQTFMGALAGQGATGGVFITTSGFSQQARDYVSKQMTAKIILIDGVALGKLLLSNQIGVVVQKTYRLLELDENFFDVE